MSITASADTLMSQAPETIGVYLRQADNWINRVFGEGYAKRNPQLVAAFISAAASDFNTALVCKTIEECVERVVWEFR